MNVFLCALIQPLLAGGPIELNSFYALAPAGTGYTSIEALLVNPVTLNGEYNFPSSENWKALNIRESKLEAVTDAEFPVLIRPENCS